MKKFWLLTTLLIGGLLLTGCNNSSGGALPEKDRETVMLTADNYSKYIAVYTTTDTYYSGASYSIYHYYLVGSSLCKFIDCKITYGFSNDSGEFEGGHTPYEINLTISGCGESTEVSKRVGYGGYYHFSVISASGSVEIIY